MSMFSSIRTFLGFVFRRRRVEREMEEELRSHLQIRADDLERQGLSRSEAERQARVEFGGYQRYKEECREALGTRLIGELTADLRYGLRQLRRNPGFTAVAVITLALGIAANTTIFSTVSLVLLKKPAVPDPDRLMVVFSNNKPRGYNYLRVSVPNYKAFQRQNDVFQGVAADAHDGFTLTGSGSPEHVTGDRVTANYFRVLGVSPALGRDFLPNEDQVGRNRVVILSSGLWKQHFASKPKVLGTTVEIDGQPYTVIGVMPAGTDTPIEQPQLWTPLVFRAKDLSDASRPSRYLYVFARLKPGVTTDRARAEIATLASGIARRHPNNEKGWGANVLTLQQYTIQAPQVEASLTVLMGAVVFVLLIACANIAGLLLARAAGRRQEMALRAALGAGRLRVIRQLLTESLLIALAGGGLGVILGLWGISVLRMGINWNSYVLYLARNLHLDGHTLLFTVALTLGATVLFGLAPALRGSNPDLVASLKEGGRFGTDGFARSRLRGVLVSAEIALSVVLLVGASVFIDGFLFELTQNPGFNESHVITVEVSLSSREYKNSPSKQAAFFERVTRRLRNLPGVKSASATWALPLSGGEQRTVKIEGHRHAPLTNLYLVGSRYFQAMEIPLIKGREFSLMDNAYSPMVAVVSQAFARKYFPKGNAIGRRVYAYTPHPKWAEIVGTVGNVKDYPGQVENPPQVYEPYAQQPVAAMTIIARTRYAAAAFAPLLRRTVWSVDKDQPVEDLITMERIANNTGISAYRFMSGLLGAFAGLALILSAVGIYGIIAYSVAQRTHEIGIRMALGAEKRDVLSLVLRRGGLLTIIGCAIGLALALPLPKLFSAMFNGMPVVGSQVFAIVVPLVAVASLLATYIPARRATKVDPMVALRHE